MLANMYQHSATLANFSSSCFPLPNHLVHAYIQLFLHGARQACGPTQNSFSHVPTHILEKLVHTYIQQIIIHIHMPAGLSYVVNTSKSLYISLSMPY